MFKGIQHHAVTRPSLCSTGRARHTRTRYLHDTRRLNQQSLATVANASVSQSPPPYITSTSIRQRLKIWQERNGNPLTDLLAARELGELGPSYGERSDKDNNGDEVDEFDVLDDGDALLLAKGMIFNPGDLIEYTPNARSPTRVLGIFIRNIDSEYIQVITYRGSWDHVPRNRVQFSFHDFIDAKLIPPILPHLPTAETTAAVLSQSSIVDVAAPRTVTAPLISAIAHLRTKSDEVYRRNAALFDNVHDILAHDTDLRFGSLEKITQNLLALKQSATQPELYAVRKALAAAGIGFGSDNNAHRVTGVFQIRSKEQLRQISLARDWIRDFQEAETLRVASQETRDSKPASHSKRGVSIVREFLDKARERIKSSRKFREAGKHGGIGPSMERFPITAEKGAYYATPVQPFTSNELILIRFIEYWSVQRLFAADHSLRSLATLLVRRTNLYSEHEIDQFTGYLFLQENGVYAPYVNTDIFDVNLLLPISEHSKPLSRLSTQMAEMSSQDVDMKDSMADLRHDWKDLTAYAIDPPGAKEIDDAISVEQIEGCSTEFWIHIHIANPTAFLKRNSTFAKMASHLTETLYLPEMSVPLLPEWLGREFVSLQSNRPCLTFTGRINLDGELLETKIQPGFIRNVIHLEYNDLPGILEVPNDSSLGSYSLIVGGEVTKTKRGSPPSLSPRHINDLKLLWKITQASLNRRERDGSLSTVMSRADASVYWKAGHPDLPHILPHRETPVMIHGDPLIEIQSTKFVNWFDKSALQQANAVEHIVSEMMILGCCIGARWCSERNIPILYRGTAQHSSSKMEEGNFKVMLEKAREKYGAVPLSTGMNYLSNRGRAVINSQPLRHSILGVEEYARTTSPLRRFADMVSHWQIEAAIREESRSGIGSLKRAPTSKQLSFLPYSRASLDNVMSRLEPREIFIRKAKQTGIYHWICQAFLRALDYGEAEMPRRAQIVIVAKARQGIGPTGAASWGFLLNSSIRIQVLPKDEEALAMFSFLEPGDVWEMEYWKTNTYMKSITYSPIQLVRKEIDPE